MKIWLLQRLNAGPRASGSDCAASEAGVTGRLLFAAGGDLYIISANGVGRQALTTSEAFESMPTWSPDGSYIAFASASDGNQEMPVLLQDFLDDRELLPGEAPQAVPPRADVDVHENRGVVEDRRYDGRSGDAQMIEIEKLPVSQRREAIYGVAAD